MTRPGSDSDITGIVERIQRASLTTEWPRMRMALVDFLDAYLEVEEEALAARTQLVKSDSPTE